MLFRSGVLPGHQEGEFLFKNPKGAGRPAPESSTIASALRGGEDISHAAAYVALRDASLGLGDWDEAMTLYREALRVDPSNVKAHDGLAALLSYRDDWDRVIQEEREAIRLKSDDAEAHYGMALALGNKGDVEGEIREEREAIRLKPDYAQAHYILGSALGV